LYNIFIGIRIYYYTTMSKIIIKNGTLVTSEKTFESDILISNGLIIKISESISENGAEIIDATGKYIFPGAIDAHVHFALPTPAGNSSDDFFTGSKAAVSGGTTTFIDFVTPQKGESLLDAFDKRLKEAENSIIDFGLHSSITEFTKTTLDEMLLCADEKGTPSFKTYLAYKGKNGVGIDDDDFLKVLDSAAKIGALVTVHAEQGDLINFLRQKYVSEGRTSPEYHPKSRPPEAEADAVNRAITFAKFTECPLYFVHVSTKQSLQLIAKAQQNGQKVFAETCPHYLVLDETVYNQKFEKSAPYVLSPPIRHKHHQKNIWKALTDNVIQVAATDHCPFNLKTQKELGRHDFTKIPNGAGSVEFRLPLLYTYGVLTGRISINQFVDMCSTQPAKIFGMYSKKGDLKPGFDADIVIWNPEATRILSASNQFQNCDSNIYEGISVKGNAETVIANGKILFSHEKFLDETVRGKYIFRERMRF